MLKQQRESVGLNAGDGNGSNQHQKGNQSHDETGSNQYQQSQSQPETTEIPTLSVMGICNSMSSRAQDIADIFSAGVRGSDS